MWRVPLTTIFDLVFAAGLIGAAVALVGATLGRLNGRALRLITALELVAAVAAWLAFALSHDHDRELAIAAGGLTCSALVAAAAVVLRHAHDRTDAIDAHFAEAQKRLQGLVDEEAAARAADLERTLARARADSASL